jgi:hypothetical protein
MRIKLQKTVFAPILCRFYDQSRKFGRVEIDHWTIIPPNSHCSKQILRKTHNGNEMFFDVIPIFRRSSRKGRIRFILLWLLGCEWRGGIVFAADKKWQFRSLNWVFNSEFAREGGFWSIHLSVIDIFYTKPQVYSTLGIKTLR